MGRGALRLKGSGGALGAGERKKKAKDTAQIPEQITSSKKQEEEEEEEEEECGLDKRTPARVAFEKMQEKQQRERILKEALKARRQRGEELSRHLDALPEHHGIPRASWTD